MAGIGSTLEEHLERRLGGDRVVTGEQCAGRDDEVARPDRRVRRLRVRGGEEPVHVTGDLGGDRPGGRVEGGGRVGGQGEGPVAAREREHEQGRRRPGAVAQPAPPGVGGHVVDDDRRPRPCRRGPGTAGEGLGRRPRHVARRHRDRSGRRTATTNRAHCTDGAICRACPQSRSRASTGTASASSRGRPAPWSRSWARRASRAMTTARRRASATSARSARASVRTAVAAGRPASEASSVAR